MKVKTIRELRRAVRLTLRETEAAYKAIESAHDTRWRLKSALDAVSQESEVDGLKAYLNGTFAALDNAPTFSGIWEERKQLRALADLIGVR